jgi:hypothetical protein
VTGYLAIAAGRYEIARPRLERLLEETDERRGRLRRALEMLPD